MNPYPHLLSPMKVGNTLFKNRIFTAPTGVHALQNGELGFQEAVITHFGNRAKGGAAMVTCTGVQVNPEIRRQPSPCKSLYHRGTAESLQARCPGASFWRRGIDAAFRPVSL